MDLPVVRQKGNALLPICKKEIETIEWSVSEILQFSNNVESCKDLIKSVKIIDDFIGSKVSFTDGSEFKFSDLNYIDGFVLAIELREFSKGKSIVERLYNCTCGHISQIIKIDLSKYTIIKPTIDIIKLREDLILQFGDVTVGDILLNPLNSLLDIALKSVTYKGKDYPSESISISKKFLDDLGEVEYLILKNKMDDITGKFNKYKYYCGTCKKENTFNIQLYDFFL